MPVESRTKHESIVWGVYSCAVDERVVFLWILQRRSLPFHFERVDPSVLKASNDLVLLEFAVQGRERNLQQSCGFCFVALGMLQDLLDLDALRTCEGKCRHFRALRTLGTDL